MMLSIYVMYDKKVGYMQPTFSYSDEEAIRGFNYALMKQDFFAVNKEDFSLYQIGTYNTESGTINARVEPRWVADSISSDPLPTGKKGEKVEV